MPRRIKLTLEYDGAAFRGWQIQEGGAPGEGPARGARTVQGEVEAALGKIFGQGLRITAASRTDAGVHAEGQVASFDLPPTSALPAERLVPALNAHLPPDVSARAAEEVSADFHAQTGAKGKRYRYLIFNGRARSARLRRTHWHVRQPLNLARMREAAKHLLGRHDFRAFATAWNRIQAQRAEEGKVPLESVRELCRVEVERAAIEPPAGPPGQRIESPDREIRIEIEGSGFLYKMVRTLAGSLVEVGRERHPPSWIAEVLASRDRRRAGPTAPPHGLSLVRVFY